MQPTMSIGMMAYRFVVLACVSLAISTNQLNAFWLTDGSLFQQQPASSVITSSNLRLESKDQTNQIVQSNSLSPDKLEQLSKLANDAIDVRGGVSLSRASNILDSKPSVDAWQLVKIDATTNKTIAPQSEAQQSKQQASQEANNFVTNAPATTAATAEPTCQCNPDWLANQTNFWVGRWLNSTNFANQIRAQVLALPVAPQAKLDQQQRHQQNRAYRGTNGPGSGGGSGSSRPGVAWNRQTSKRNSIGANNHGPGDGKPAHHNRSASASGKWRTAQTANNNGQRQNQNNNNNNNHLQPNSAGQTAAKLVQGEPPGFKDARGHRLGQSGLIPVKDRSALFDLSNPPTVSKTPAEAILQQNAGQEKQPRLVLVEAEQLLVVETDSGWRPIPLLAPLHDFRKTIAKFSLSSSSSSLADDNRNKLTAQLATGGGSRMVADENNLISFVSPPFKPQIFSRDRLSFLAGLNSTSPSNPIAKAIEAAGAKLNQIGDDDDLNMDDDGEDDEDEDDDDEDDDEDEADGNEDDDDDDDNEGDDDNNVRMANAINSKVGKTGKASSNNRIGAPSSANRGSGERPKRRRAQVTGRSAISTPPQVDIVEPGDNTLGQASPGYKLSFTGSDASDTNDGRSDEGSPSKVMKLRLIALNEPFSGNQHGLRGANFECKRNAARAGIRGAFQALLATSYQNLNEIVRHNSHVQKCPIVNMRGDILAASWHDLFKSPARTTNPLSRIYSFDGRHVSTDPNWPNKLVWLGTGSKFGARDSSGHNCDGWHSDSLNKLGYASPLHPPRGHHNHHHDHSAHHFGSIKSRTQQRRFATSIPGGSAFGATNDDEKQTRGQNGTQVATGASSNLVFDVMERYPCRMPLIVLCIETVAQGV